MFILSLYHCLLPSLFIFLSLSNAAAALTFNFTNPTQCDDLTVNWTGGTPPFKLLIIVPGQLSTTTPIPDATFQAGTGSFTTQLKVGEHKRVMFAIADASGFASVVLSPLLTVGASTRGSQCNTTVPAIPFYFALDNDLRECQTYPFTQFIESGAIQPVTIYGFIPSSKVLMLPVTTGAKSFDWQNDLPAGTQVAFSMIDAQGRAGGTADVKVVIAGEKSCLSNSTSTTIGTPPTLVPTPTTTPQASTPQASTTKGESSKALPIAAIAGGAAGGAVVLTAVAIILFFLFCRKKKRHPTLLLRKPELAYELVASNSRDGPVENIVTPFRVPSRPEPLPLKARLDQLDAPSQSGSTSALISPALFSPSTVYSGTSGYQNYQLENPGSEPSIYSQPSQSQRVIVHRDITETGGEGQMLELPPQYSALRAPIPGLSSAEPSPSSSPRSSPTRSGRRKRRS